MVAIKDFHQKNEYLWEIPKTFRSDMRVPARIYATQHMLEHIQNDHSIDQIVNVSTLPGIQKHALIMPDAHEGYGFPIGGVAAFDENEGIISPGGIGYDINCGVRLLKSIVRYEVIKTKLETLSETIYRTVPSGVGKGGRLKLNKIDLDTITKKGVKRIIEMGYGEAEDVEHIESQGSLEEADPSMVSDHAKKRGNDQIGTMGAGNHFVEVDRIDTIYDQEIAEKFDLHKDQIVILIHTGSRGYGHQIATDYIKTMIRAMPKYNIHLPDRELACAPFHSPEGQNYFQAMCCGANYAWANRQMITYEVRQAWEEVFGRSNGELEILYDVAHNIAKLEKYEIDDISKELVIHRKGATRSFPNQPVLIPGSMGTHSYVLVGQEKSLQESFGSTCHGAGRMMSRSKAKKKVNAEELQKELKNKGIAIKFGSYRGLAEEAPIAYKDIDEVIEVVDNAGLARKVARLTPVAVVKG